MKKILCFLLAILMLVSVVACNDTQDPAETTDSVAEVTDAASETEAETTEAAVTGKKEHIYHAAMLDPHTAAELSLDEIIRMCDELYDAHTAAGFPIL